jgi:hypothetical protein
MWTEEQHRIYRREGESYSSDLRDAEWARLEPMIAPSAARWAAAQDRNAGGDERHSLFAAHPAAHGESEPESRLLKKLFAFGDEA